MICSVFQSLFPDTVQDFSNMQHEEEFAVSPPTNLGLYFVHHTLSPYIDVYKVRLYNLLHLTLLPTANPFAGQSPFATSNPFMDGVQGDGDMQHMMEGSEGFGSQEFNEPGLDGGFGDDEFLSTGEHAWYNKLHGISYAAHVASFS